MAQTENQVCARIPTALSPEDAILTGWCGVRWKRFGDRIAGAKNLRKIKLLTAVYLTSGSSVI